MSSTNRQTAAALVLASALIHASWNLAARAVKGDTSVMVLGLCTVAPTLLFVGLMTQSATTNRQRDTLEGLRGGWYYVLITGVVHAIYLLLLSHAYKIGDLSVVYPIARGSSVVFVAVFSRLIIPDQDRMSSLGLIGVAVVVVEDLGRFSHAGRATLRGLEHGAGHPLRPRAAVACPIARCELGRL